MFWMRWVRDARGTPKSDVQCPLGGVVQRIKQEDWRGVQEHIRVSGNHPASRWGYSDTEPLPEADPGEADINFHLRGRTPHLSWGWSASQLFMFIRLIPKYCLPPLISLSIYCLQNSQDRQRQTPPQMLNWLNDGEDCLFNLPLWLFGIYGASYPGFQDPPHVQVSVELGGQTMGYFAFSTKGSYLFVSHWPPSSKNLLIWKMHVCVGNV